MLEGWQETQAECRQTNASIKDSEEQIKEYPISLLRRKGWVIDQAKGKGRDTEQASQCSSPPHEGSFAAGIRIQEHLGSESAALRLSTTWKFSQSVHLVDLQHRCGVSSLGSQSILGNRNR